MICNILVTKIGGLVWKQVKNLYRICPVLGGYKSWITGREVCVQRWNRLLCSCSWRVGSELCTHLKNNSEESEFPFRRVACAKCVGVQTGECALIVVGRQCKTFLNLAFRFRLARVRYLVWRIPASSCEGLLRRVAKNLQPTTTITTTTAAFISAVIIDQQQSAIECNDGQISISFSYYHIFFMMGKQQSSTSKLGSCVVVRISLSHRNQL